MKLFSRIHSNQCLNFLKVAVNQCYLHSPTSISHSRLFHMLPKWNCSPSQLNKMKVSPSVYNRWHTKRMCSTSVKCVAVNEVLKHWVLKLSEEGIDEAQESVEHILAHVFGSKGKADVHKHTNRTLTEEELNTVNRLCECRMARMPVQYIIGEWDFRDLQLKLVPPVFIPRPETEQLVDIVSQHLQPGFHILDVGCGSGAISIALLKMHPQVRCTAIDQSSVACNITKQNASLHGVLDRLEVIKAKLTAEGLEGVSRREFDLIVSNPPYVPRKDMFNLQPEIMIYEDLRALDGGADGLGVIKPLLKLASEWLVKHGKILLEVDPSHPQLLCEWLRSEPALQLQLVQSLKDFSGKERFVEIHKVDVAR